MAGRSKNGRQVVASLENGVVLCERDCEESEEKREIGVTSPLKTNPITLIFLAQNYVS